MDSSSLSFQSKTQKNIKSKFSSKPVSFLKPLQNPVFLPGKLSANLRSNTRISKYCSWVLRHGAGEINLKMTFDGYVCVSDLIKTSQKYKITNEHIFHLVASDKKQRYSLLKESDQIFIRANQGHSIPNISVDMTEITSSNVKTLVPDSLVVHGTNRQAWKSIKENGLNKMKRQHIHFALGMPLNDSVVSGIRTNASIFIWVDVAQCLKDSIPFYKSLNGVILTPGPIPVEKFSKVLDTAGKSLL